MSDKENNVIGVNFEYNKVKPLLNEHAMQFEQDLIDAINKAVDNGVSAAVVITFLQLYLFKVTQELSDAVDEE